MSVGGTPEQGWYRRQPWLTRAVLVPGAALIAVCLALSIALHSQFLMTLTGTLWVGWGLSPIWWPVTAALRGKVGDGMLRRRLTEEVLASASRMREAFRAGEDSVSLPSLTIRFDRELEDVGGYALQGQDEIFYVTSEALEQSDEALAATIAEGCVAPRRERRDVEAALRSPGQEDRAVEPERRLGRVEYQFTVEHTSRPGGCGVLLWPGAWHGRWEDSWKQRPLLLLKPDGQLMAGRLAGIADPLSIRHLVPPARGLAHRAPMLLSDLVLADVPPGSQALFADEPLVKLARGRGRLFESGEGTDGLTFPVIPPDLNDLFDDLDCSDGNGEVDRLASSLELWRQMGPGSARDMTVRLAPGDHRACSQWSACAGREDRPGNGAARASSDIAASRPRAVGCGRFRLRWAARARVRDCACFRRRRVLHPRIDGGPRVPCSVAALRGRRRRVRLPIAMPADAGHGPTRVHGLVRLHDHALGWQEGGCAAANARRARRLHTGGYVHCRASDLSSCKRLAACGGRDVRSQKTRCPSTGFQKSSGGGGRTCWAGPQTAARSRRQRVVRCGLTPMS